MVPRWFARAAVSRIGVMVLAGTAQRATYREVFAVAEFRALWLAQLLSVAGDQLAKVALTVLVYARTHSSVLAMAVPGMPLAVTVTLLFVVSMLMAPFNSARAAVYPDVLAGDRYVIGTAVTLTTYQLAQVVGFAAGGAVVGFFGARPALLVDAATFAVSALLIQVRVQRRPASKHDGARAAPLADMMAGLRLVFTHANLRTLMLFGWVAAFYNVPEGVAAPFARQLHAGAVGVGLLLAAGPAGYTLGAAAFGRFVPPLRRARLMAPLAAACCLILVLIAVQPELPMALLILAASGACSCFQVAANSEFVLATPPGQRSQAFGLATGGMGLGQGVAMIAAGAAALHFPPSAVIACSGAIGVLAVLAITAGSPRSLQ